MDSESVIIRFPTGAWEYGVTEHLPEVGDTLERQGVTWTVVRVTGPPGNRIVTMGNVPDVVDP